MPISLSNEAKSGVSLSNEAKSNIDLSLGESKDRLDLANESKVFKDGTWDEANYTWNEADFTWDNQKLILSRETKSNVSLNNESK